MSAQPVTAEPLIPGGRRTGRLRRTSQQQPGWTRRRRGRGWVYRDATGRPIREPERLQRIRDLAIPPAWRDVWICPVPNGHLQAVGTDARGRRQYLYHAQWRSRRDREKHERVLTFATRLPAARSRAQADLARPGMPRERVLATAFRLLDLGLFRIGGETYADENGSYGLATLRKDHVRISHGSVQFAYTAKSGRHRRVTVHDDDVRRVVVALLRRHGGGEELLAWRDGDRWRDVVSDDINGYLKALIGPDVSAKDFRTWHATVLAAVVLAEVPDRPRSERVTRREVAHAMRVVSEQLGNTPAVCRASYVDPRVVDRFAEGVTIRASLRRLGRAAFDDLEVRPQVERAVLRLLRPPSGARPARTLRAGGGGRARRGKALPRDDDGGRHRLSDDRGDRSDRGPKRRLAETGHARSVSG